MRNVQSLRHSKDFIVANVSDFRANEQFCGEFDDYFDRGIHVLWCGQPCFIDKLSVHVTDHIVGKLYDMQRQPNDHAAARPEDYLTLQAKLKDTLQGFHFCIFMSQSNESAPNPYGVLALPIERISIKTRRWEVKCALIPFEVKHFRHLRGQSLEAKIDLITAYPHDDLIYVAKIFENDRRYGPLTSFHGFFGGYPTYYVFEILSKAPKYFWLELAEQWFHVTRDELVSSSRRGTLLRCIPKRKGE